MKRGLLTAAVLLLLLVPVIAQAQVGPDYQSALQAVAKAEGCNAQIVIHYDDSANEGNGMYVPRSARSIAFLYGLQPHSVHVLIGKDWTYDMNMYVGMHEIGHCLQDQNGWLGTYGEPYQEWDADIQALRMAERYGIRSEAGLDRLISRYNRHGDGGDSAHGTNTSRALNTMHYMVKRIQGA